MDKRDVRRDVNLCNARQLTSIPGVEKKIAENIVRYRQMKGKLEHFDELWQVPGMTRPKFQLLRRHFRVVKDKTPVIVGGRLPCAKLSLTESMVDFVCQGQGKRAYKPERKSSGSKKKSAFKENLIVNDATRSTSLLAKSGVPVTKVLIRRKEPRPNNDCQDKNDFVDMYKEPYAFNNNGGVNMETDPDNLDLLQAFAPGKKRNSWMLSDPKTQFPDAKPSVTLQTTPSGNNINFSCTIDKRILRHPTSVAFQLTQAKLGQPADRPSQDSNAMPCVDGAYPAPPVFTQITNVGGNSESGDECQRATNNETPVSYLPALGKTDNYPSLLSKGSTSSSSSRLSQENVLMYEKLNTLDEAHRHWLIEAWVTDVNEARRISRLLQARERLESQQQDHNISKYKREVASSKTLNPRAQSDQKCHNGLLPEDKHKRRSAENYSSHMKSNSGQKKASASHAGRRKTVRITGAVDDIDHLQYRGKTNDDFRDDPHKKALKSAIHTRDRSSDNLKYRHRIHFKTDKPLNDTHRADTGHKVTGIGPMADKKELTVKSYKSHFQKMQAKAMKGKES